jgi:hypothetical protein
MMILFLRPSVDFPFCVPSFLSWPTVDKCAASFESKSVARILHHIGLETILKSNSDSYINQGIAVIFVFTIFQK